MASKSNYNNNPKDLSVSLIKIMLISIIPALIFGLFTFFFFEWIILSDIIPAEDLTFFFAIFSGFLFYLLCIYIGIVFGRALYKRVSSKSVKSFKSFTDTLHKEIDHKNIYPNLYNYLRKMFKKSKISIYYKNIEDSKKTSWSNYPNDSIPICEMSSKTCPVLVNKKEMFVNDIQTDITCAYQLPFYTKGCYICLLIQINNSPHAVVQLYNKEKNYFDTDTVNDIKSYIEVLEPIIQNKTQLKDLNTEVYTDKLTGVKNRTFLEQQIDNLIKISDTNKEQFSLIMIDLDHFKKINDTYGHPAGDCILVEFSQIVLSCVRANDIVARYGGEEFIIVLPNSNLAYANSIAERIRASVASATMPMFEGSNLPPLTCSLGISTYPDYANDKTNLIKTADIALYSAKENGRNKVVAYDPYKLKVID